MTTETQRIKRIKIFVAVTGSEYTSGVEPRQKTRLNSICGRAPESREIAYGFSSAREFTVVSMAL